MALDAARAPDVLDAGAAAGLDLGAVVLGSRRRRHWPTVQETKRETAFGPRKLDDGVEAAEADSA